MFSDSNMTLRFIGHAGFYLQTNDYLLLMDPWVSKDGAYDSAWMQFPCNHHMADELLDLIEQYKNKCSIYISHEHKDHFDPSFLSQINKNTVELIVPDFTTDAFSKQLSVLDFPNVTFLVDEGQITREGLQITLFLDNAGINHDSGILVKSDWGSFLNLNDCKIFDRLGYIKQHYGDVDLFSVQFSGATWHPTCYEMDAEKYAQICRKKKLSKFFAVYSALQVLGPKFYIPAAGPCCFLDPELFHLNFDQDTTYPKSWEIADYLSARKNFDVFVQSMMPGDSYCFLSQEFFLEKEPLKENNFEAYLQAYQKDSLHLYNKQHSTKLDELLSVFCDHVKIKANKIAKKHYDSTYYIYFRFHEQDNIYIVVSPKFNEVKIVNEVTTENNYIVSYPAWEVERLLAGAINWEDLALTFRAKLKRNPDMYNTFVNCFLFSSEDDIEERFNLVESISSEDQERIVIEAGGKRYEINAKCPHQGGSLRYGWEDDDGYWVCPRHRWRFNLDDDGKCIDSNYQISAVVVDDDR